MFSKFSRALSYCLGHPATITLAFLIILIWFILGPILNYSENWQLFITTTTAIITFLMVFLLQNTQNHDTVAVHLKLDEIIRAMDDSHNELLKSEELSDKELEKLLKRYEKLASQVKNKIKRGKGDKGNPED